jgi:hypothetical protein
LPKISNLAGALFFATVLWSRRASRSSGVPRKSGNHSGLIDGQILTGPLVGLDNGITLEPFDGNGNFTSIDHVVLNGVQPAMDLKLSSGTYTVNPDCTREKVVTFLNNVPPPRITFFVVTDSGKHMDFVSGNSGVALSGVFTRLSGSDNHGVPWRFGLGIEGPDLWADCRYPELI